MAFECVDSANLIITHILSGKSVTFSRIKLTGFSDQVSTNWNQENVYGRMDPIVTFQNTTREISLSFDLGPYSLSDDRKRLALAKVSRLMQFQYPSYVDENDALSISRPPLLRVSFANYIRSGTGGPLLCYMDGMSYSPIDGMSAQSVPKIVGGEILPQRIAVSLAMNVLHENPVGWSDSGEWMFGKGDQWSKTSLDLGGEVEAVQSVAQADITDLPEGEQANLSAGGTLDG
jgi:hypothetical protein